LIEVLQRKIKIMLFRALKVWIDQCSNELSYRNKLKFADQIAVALKERTDLEERVRYLQDQIEGKERVIEALSETS
jgi:hypothetical protein